MLIYKTPSGDLPEKVQRIWKEFAVEYAKQQNLGTKNEVDAWEVPSIIPGTFPVIALLLYQYPSNVNGNCGKVIVQAGYEDIKNVEKIVGELPGCEEIEYKGGMMVPLHSHPKLVFRGPQFLGSVVGEYTNNDHTLYRTRTIEGNYVHSDIYAKINFDKRFRLPIQEATGIAVAQYVAREATFELPVRSADYPSRIASTPLSSYYREELFTRDPDSEIFTIRVGKQEQFTGLSDQPMLVGSEGEDNLGDYGLVLPPQVDDNIATTHRHVDILRKGEISPPVRWHWIITGDKTAAVGEVSGMPHLGQGSIDAGDLFYRRNHQQEDPLFVKYLRTKVLEGH